MSTLSMNRKSTIRIFKIIIPITLLRVLLLSGSFYTYLEQGSTGKNMFFMP